jgi:hypothetical protein
MTTEPSIPPYHRAVGDHQDSQAAPTLADLINHYPGVIEAHRLNAATSIEPPVDIFVSPPCQLFAGRGR